MSGGESYSRVNIENIKIIEDLIPEDRDIAVWAIDSYNKLMTNQDAGLIHIKVKEDLFIEIIKNLYKKVGKSVMLYQEGSFLFKIPLKKGNSFFEYIQKVILFSEELRSEVIQIHC
jgi:hypothetical protein